MQEGVGAEVGGTGSREIVAQVPVRDYPVYVPEPVTSQEIILIFLNEFFLHLFSFKTPILYEKQKEYKEYSWFLNRQ